MANPEENNLLTKKVVTTEEYVPLELQKNDYVIQPFTEDQEKEAYNDAKKSSAFTELLEERDAKLKKYKGRYDNNIKAAKALAWGNLITSLGKLAGWGNAPVVKSDNSHLMNVFGEVDRVSELYNQTSDAYKNAERKMIHDYVNRARDTHNASEKAKYNARQREVDLINEAALKRTGKTTTREEYTHDPLQELKEQKLKMDIATIQARKDLTEQQKNKIIAEIQRGGNTKPFYAYASNDGYTYNLDKSQAIDIITRLKQDLNSPPENVSQQYLSNLKNDIGLLETALQYGQSDNATQAIIAQYLSSDPQRFQDILSRSQRVKTSTNILFTPDSEEVDIDTEIF